MGKISSITEFFTAYDAYDQRMLEAWELAIIFLDSISREEAQRFVNHYG